MIVLVIVLAHCGIVCVSAFQPGYRRSVRSTAPIQRSELSMVTLPTNLPITIPSKISEVVSSMRFNSKVVNFGALTAIIVAFRNKIGANIRKGTSNVMESGWIRRGDGTAAQRTFEVWSFTFSFAYKWVSCKKRVVFFRPFLA